jgi:uncharacterized repeat protein (TIGR04076 family)
VHRCKITVLKRMANHDLVEEYMGEEYKARHLAPCPNLAEGQEFAADSPGVVPEGFCAGAWANIHKEIIQHQISGEKTCLF